MNNFDINIKEISDKFKTFLDNYFKFFNVNYFKASLFETKEELNNSLEEWFNDVYEEEDFHYVLENFSLGLLEAEEEKLIKMIEKYYKAANDMYCYYEFKYTGFGGNLDYLYLFNPLWLYLCAIYYEHTNNEIFSVNAYFFCLLTICKSFDSYLGLKDDNESENITDLIEVFEPQLENIKNILYPDWLTLNPALTLVIGSYYLRKRNYEKAFEFFEIGSNFDYDGRQSFEPFLKVANNKYELGLLYLNGLGVRQDTSYALELFQSVANESGNEYLPIMGDIYYEGKDVKKDYDLALECYCTENRSGYYLYYYDIDNEKLIKLDDILQTKLKNENLSKDELNYIANIYLFILNDEDKENEVRKLIED